MEQLIELDNRKYDRMAVFKFIVGYKMSHDGNSPTIRDIKSEFEISSTSVANYIVRNLCAMGLIYLPRGHAGRTIARGIEVVGGEWTCRVEV
jgi:predicted MarR family transcription regulator